MKPLSSIALFSLALLFAPVSAARQAVEFSDYVVHYSAFGSDMLHPPVAKTYGIARSHNRAVLTVAIQRKGNQAAADVKAEVSVTAVNLNQQLRQLKMREVREGDAVYYLADFPVSDEEVLDFEVKVRPVEAQQPYTFRFRQQFFTQPPG